ncbi:MAG: sulfur carrier protein ThiS adenylyltransferase ThiF [Coriobacteriaceae bacterium]|nr:sulfur carrier protein ThiS adenylyltransferase ThiF [Coriobacteriaceae bacterium]
MAPQSKIPREQLRAARIERQGKEATERFEQARVGIAGLGGLGSNIAVQLSHLGVGQLVLVDFDRVDASNLARQHYRLDDVGRLKTEALVEQLREIDPWLDYTTCDERIDADNVAEIFGGCDIICEAFDDAGQKVMLVEAVRSRLPDAVLVGGVGVAGTNSANRIHSRRRLENYYLCGDEQADVADGEVLMAPRVAAVAAHQANMVMRILLGETEEEDEA